MYSTATELPDDGRGELLLRLACDASADLRRAKAKYGPDSPVTAALRQRDSNYRAMVSREVAP